MVNHRMMKELTFGIKKYEYKMIDNVVGYPVLTIFYQRTEDLSEKEAIGE